MMKLEQLDKNKCGQIYRTDAGKYTFGCVYCNEAFDTPTNILDHIELHFKTHETYLPQEINSNVNYSIDNNIHECGSTDDNILNSNNNQIYVSTTPKQLVLNHYRIPTNISAPMPPIKQKKQRIPIETKSNSSKKGPAVKCKICGMFLSGYRLNAHMEVHENLRSYKCDICNRGYNTKSLLQKHFVRHSAQKRFSCDMCGLFFHEKGNLMQHILKHTGEKPYKCKICNKGFSQSSYINIHMRIHTGDKPYKCSICIAIFNSKNRLNSHMQIHKDEKPYKCDICDQVYHRSHSLREHKRTHTGERPYACDICDKCFTRKETYRQHYKLHTGEKPYKCRYCDLVFAQTAGRRSHEKCKHKVL